MRINWIYSSLLGIFLTGCSRSVIESVRFHSPNGRWVLEATGNDHGALAASLTVVNVHLATEGWKSENNVLIVPGVHTVNAGWDNNNTVRIDCIQCPFGDAELIVVKKGPVQIRYGTATF